MIFETIRAIIAEQFGIAADEITMDTNILEDLGADSLDSIKKRTRAGMGFCQGRTCRKLIARMLAEYYSQPADSYLPGSIRLPVAPVKLGLIAETEDAFCSCKSKEE